ncbi:titin homolog isoform X6 [Penaeus vannamei]|uniref:titin homolog isoform X6 n=1 Tax=Penaeus vannamei TaxID=6689 RepID=UPI00387FAFC4
MPGNVRNTGQNDSHRTPITSAARTKSLDCLADKSDKTSEYVPSRITRTQPKIKADAMQFVKTGPAGLYKSATEQIKKAEAVKAMRKHLIAEEEDWQQNLDKWKSSRRKRNEDALERVIEIKKNEQEEELNRTRRKSKTFSEMQEEKNKRGRRYNLVVHDDDNNDLADLGLSTVKSSGSLYDGQEDNDVKDLDQDNKDAKSDAGFCTGSDTGSDGVFAEDNISDTSSALGDKKETHDSLLDTGVSKEEEPRINGHGSSLTSDILNTNNANLYTEEYTYDKAIEGYKQYAENTAKKRTSSITSLNSNTSFTKEDERKDERPRLNGRSPSPAKSNKLEEKLNFFTKEMVKESRTSPEPRVIMREKSPKVDVGKRRSMFEMGEPLISQSEREQKQANRRSLEVPGSLRNKVASFENLDMDTPKVRGMTPNIETNLKSKVKSFENLDTETTKVRGVTPTRDTKFREKLASFAAADTESQTVRKKTPERDVNFHKKLASFTSIENGEEEKCVERKTIPLRDPTLKNKIASFEQLEQAAEAYSQPPREEPMKNRDRSVSLENLDEPPPVKEVMRPAVSMGNMGLMRRAPSTPYMVVDLDKTGVEEESCIREKRPVVSDEQESAGARDQAKRSTIYETIEKCQVVRDVESAPMFSIFQYLSPEVNAQVFEIASKLEETPLLGSPTLRDPSVPLPEPPVQEQDSFEGAKPYTDEDINEVISDYEQVGSVYEEASEHVENIYENITEEPVYENIYEKVGDEIQGEIEEPVNEPHYQTLEEVREEVSANVEPAPAPPSPPQQVASKPPPVIEPPEVLDVTWTDGPSQAAPPCVPPPPPPPDDDSDDDASDQPQGLPEQAEDEPFTRENSTRRIKKELWRRRSDFLGTSSQYIEEEPTVKPPPDLSELLRQEREAERIMAESQRARTPIQETLSKAEIARREKEIIESLERSEQLKQQQQQQQLQYTWQDHMAEETTMTEEQKQLSEHLEYQVAQTESTSSESDIDIQVATNVPVTSANIPTTSQSVMDSKELETMETSSQSPDETFEALPISSKDTVDSVETKAEMLETHVIEPNTTVAKVLPTQTQMEVEAENNVQPESSQQYTDLLESHYSTLDYSSDSVASTGSHPDPYKKLAELEEEMMRHDQDMLQRAGKLAPASTISNDAQPAHIPPPTMYASQEGAPVPSPQAPQTAENNNYSNYQPPAPQLPIQEFYTAPTYEPTPPSSLAPAEGVASPGQKAVSPPTGSPSQYSTLASPHPFTRSHSQSSIGAPPIHPPLQGIRSSPTGSPRDPAPEPLPRKKKLPPPPPSKPHQISGDSTERSEAIRLSRMPTSNPNSVSPQPQEIQGEAVSPSGQQMSKQTLLALSAIPKPRLTDNESWITKKKPESQRRDYSKHWLHQEAEQRRLEQQDRVNRQQQARAPAPKTLPPQSVSPQQPPHPQTTSYLPTYPPQNASPTYSSYPQALKNPSPIQSNNNNNNNNMWRNQATTYQPHMPTQAPNGDKALPDSIIHNITQRVNNKNSKNTYSNTNGRLGNTYGNNNYRDENYHDYMNADALSAPSTHTPLYQSGMGPSQQPPFNSQSQDHSSGQDQRLLSVSGKKKCSHCSEELGRGAAMIIESLRLFYHIPCFKCCVCGIQLGNGSAGADVRVRNHKLHCHNCYSNDEGMKFSKV